MCGSISAWNTCDDVIDVATWIARWSGRAIAPKSHVRLLRYCYATEPERFIHPASVSAVPEPGLESSVPMHLSRTQPCEEVVTLERLHQMATQQARRAPPASVIENSPSLLADPCVGA
jgi:hypothetical protein